MTNQEAFDIVARHLLMQKQRAEEYDAVGAYPVLVDSAGRRCAIGALIPEGKFRPWMSNSSPISALSAVLSGDIPSPLFLVRLRDLHDSVNPCHWKKGLLKIACEFELDAGIVGEIK